MQQKYNAESRETVYKWAIPDSAQSRDVIIAGIQNAIAGINNPWTIGYPNSPFAMVPGPDFASSSPPTQHEDDVARLYDTISLIVWVFLRSDLVKTHFPQSHIPDLAAPREVKSLAKSYVGRNRKPDIAVIHRPPPGSNSLPKTVSEWCQIACIGVWYQLCIIGRIAYYIIT
jgi:hypothetical protein